MEKKVIKNAIQNALVIECLEEVKVGVSINFVKSSVDTTITKYFLYFFQGESVIIAK